MLHTEEIKKAIQNVSDELTSNISFSALEKIAINQSLSGDLKSNSINILNRIEEIINYIYYAVPENGKKHYNYIMNKLIPCVVA